MAEIGIFFYALVTAFVLTSMQRNQRLQRPTPRTMMLVGWGLFSLSSTLALLMAGVALLLAFGYRVPIAGL
ncbi:MAG: hypothetical protein ACOY45_06480 [Pseudomonadota bacterium]